MGVSRVNTCGSISKVPMLIEKKGRLDHRKRERIPQRIHSLVIRVLLLLNLIGQGPVLEPDSAPYEQSFTFMFRLE